VAVPCDVDGNGSGLPAIEAVTRIGASRHRESRSAAHHLISVLACQAIQYLRRRRKEFDPSHNDSWVTIRGELNFARRVTTAYPHREGGHLRVRKADSLNAVQMEIHEGMGIPPPADNVHKTCT